MSIPLPSFDKIPQQAEEFAEKIRGDYNLGDRGIQDLFHFAENSMDFLLFRYPYGEQVLQGFAAYFKGYRLIASNSSVRLGREVFTLAHEIGHHELDLDPEKGELIGDQKTGHYSWKNPHEYRADCFAACFLMPREGLKRAFLELQQSWGLSHALILQLQIEFKVSYSALVWRLLNLGLVTKEQLDWLLQYKEVTGMYLTELAERYGGEKQLIEPSKTVHIPERFMNALKSNYVNGWIDDKAFEETLGLVGISSGQAGIRVEKKYENDDEDFNDAFFDELLLEYSSDE